jgi:hypothetical protein
MNILMKYSPVLKTRRQHYLLAPKKCPYSLVLFHFSKHQDQRFLQLRKYKRLTFSKIFCKSKQATFYFVLFYVCSFIYLSIYFFYLHVYLWITCTSGTQGCQKKMIRSLGSGFTDGCEPLCGWCEWNLGPQEEQSVLLTAEPSLQPLPIPFYSHSLLLGQKLLLDVILACPQILTSFLPSRWLDPGFMLLCWTHSRAFTCPDQCSCYWKVLCTREEGNVVMLKNVLWVSLIKILIFPPEKQTKPQLLWFHACDWIPLSNSSLIEVTWLVWSQFSTNIRRYHWQWWQRSSEVYRGQCDAGCGGTHQ